MIGAEDLYYYFCYDVYIEENWQKCSKKAIAKQNSLKQSISDNSDTTNVSEVIPLEILLTNIVTIGFDEQKESIIPSLEQNIQDKSRATHADEAIHPLLFAINHHSTDDYFTTSSCAGRTIVTQSCPTSGYNVDWLFITHDFAVSDEVYAAIETRKQTDCKSYEVWLKMEPPIVAICCRNLNAAQKLLDLARKCGFKKPTITGVRNKVVVSIVDNHKLELPIALDGDLLIGKEYLSTVVRLCNEKLTASRERIERLRQALRAGTERNTSRCSCTHG